ncbi:unnamed protein product, partial [Acidithrix sp. C25]
VGQIRSLNRALGGCVGDQLAIFSEDLNEVDLRVFFLDQRLILGYLEG